MHFVVSVSVDQNHYLAIQEPKRHHSFLAIVLPPVFTRDGEIVPDGLGPFEVQIVRRNISSAFGFIPGGHRHIVGTICLA